VDAREKTLTGDQEFKRQLLQSATSFSQKTGGTSNGLIRASSGAMTQSHADINQLKLSNDFTPSTSLKQSLI
jgi:hypothetical protein